jgi:hypothetical protein
VVESPFSPLPPLDDTTPSCPGFLHVTPTTAQPIMQLALLLIPSCSIPHLATLRFPKHQKSPPFFIRRQKATGQNRATRPVKSDRYSNQYALSLAKLTCHRQPRSESSSIQICRTKVCSPGSCVVAHVSPRQDHPLPLGGCVGYTSSAVPY